MCFSKYLLFLLSVVNEIKNILDGIIFGNIRLNLS